MSSKIYRKIMVATDGSEFVRRAVASAVEIARLSGAKLYALHVIGYDELSVVYYKDDGLEEAALDFYRIEGKEATAM